MKRAALYLSLCATAILQSAPPVAAPAPPVKIQLRIDNIKAQRPFAGNAIPGRRIPYQANGRPNIGLPSHKNVESVFLINGDSFTGKFVGLDAKIGLLWEHPFMQPKPLAIDSTKINRVTFASKPLPAGALNGTTRVNFTNGDELMGELVSLNKDTLILNTWYGGKLTLQRNSLRQLIPGQKSQDALYSGPNEKEKWTHSNSYAAMPVPNAIQLPPERLAQLKARGAARWALKDGALQCNGVGAQIGRNFNLPDLVNIEFDLEWTSVPSLYINLFTDNLKHYTQGNAYSLRISSTSIFIYRYSQGRGNKLGATARYTAHIQPGAPAGARYSIRIDKQKKTILLYVNDLFISKWVDPAPFAGSAQGIMFSARTANPMRLSNLRISPWDGNAPGKVDNDVADGKTDSVRLANSDILKGSLNGINDNTLSFTYFEADMQIKLGKISTIHFRKPDKVLAAPAQAVRLTLKNRGRLTCALKEWKDGKVRISTPALGEATLDADIIQALDFNPGATSAIASPRTTGISTRLNINGNRIQILPQKGGLLRVQPRILPRKR